MTSSLRHALARLRSRDDQDRERGAAIVEFAIVIPFLMIMVLGMVEIGTAWKANQQVVQAARSGARTVTQLGPTDIADQQALLAVTATFEDQADRILQVVIFDAPANGQVPPGCLDGIAAPSDPCNIYDANDLLFVNSPTYFDAGYDPLNPATLTDGCGAAGASRNWCPSSRSSTQATATFVGVYVEFEQNYFTGFFGVDTYTITETTVMRIEPDTGP